MRHENLAIMFTDMSGFTQRTSEQTREENARMLQVHEALLVPVLKTFKGRLVKSIGDAFLVTFKSPTDAVRCAMAIQDRLWEYNREVEEKLRLNVRAAINVGEVRLEKGDVFGEPVNIASRVEGLAESGDIFFTEAVYLAMNKREVPSLEVGYKQLKGIPEAIRIFKVPRLVTAADERAIPPSHPYGGSALALVKEFNPALNVAQEIAAVLSSSIEERGSQLALSTRSSARALSARAELLGTRVVVRARSLLSSMLTGYTSLERRFGRRWLLIGTGVLIATLFAARAVIREQLRYDPYAEAKSLIARHSFPTALARLDELGREKAYLSDPDYLYWRGRALFGNEQLDSSMDAYGAAIHHAPEFRRDAAVIHDAVEAVATRNSAKAKQLLLKQLGPNALPAATKRVLSEESIHRWELVEVIEKLGGKNELAYADLVLLDLRVSEKCADKKRAVVKAGEHQVTEATPHLEELRNQPEYKCLQGALKTSLEQLGVASLAK